MPPVSLRCAGCDSIKHVRYNSEEGAGLIGVARLRRVVRRNLALPLFRRPST